MNTAGPTLLGFDVILVGSILSGLAAFMVIMAVYAAVTIKDPMAKRVKALNERRDELKSGIVKSAAKKRQSLVRKTEKTEKIKDTLKGMNVLQQAQVADIQQKLAHAGYRNKELAVFVIGAPNSSNSKRLVEVGARAGCAYAQLVQRATDIDWRALDGIATLGITAGASAPEELVNEVIDAFRDRYDVTVEMVETAQENVEFKVPRVLRVPA